MSKYSPESYRHYNYYGEVIKDEEVAFKLRGLHKTSFENVHFEGVMDAFLGNKLNDPCYELTFINCTIDGESVGHGGNLVNGNNCIHSSTILECSATGGHRLVLTGDSYYWNIHKNTNIGPDDSGIYTDGFGHHISNNIVIQAGKDGIKNRHTSNTKMPHGFCRIHDNTIWDYGRSKADAGAALNLQTPGNKFWNNTIAITQKGVVENPKCVHMSGGWNRGHRNTLVVPIGSNWKHLNFKNDAEATFSGYDNREWYCSPEQMKSLREERLCVRQNRG